MKKFKIFILVILCISFFSCPDFLERLQWGKLFLIYNENEVEFDVINELTEIKYKEKKEYSFMNGTELVVKCRAKSGYRIKEFSYIERKEEAPPAQDPKEDSLYVTIYKDKTIYAVAIPE